MYSMSVKFVGIYSELRVTLFISAGTVEIYQKLTLHVWKQSLIRHSARTVTLVETWNCLHIPAFFTWGPIGVCPKPYRLRLPGESSATKSTHVPEKAPKTRAFRFHECRASLRSMS